MLKSCVPRLMAALMLAVGAFTTMPVWSQAAAPVPDISQSLRKTFKAAQDAQNAKRWPEVIAKAQEVLSTSTRKPDDTYYAYYLLYDANRNLNNIPEVRRSLEGVVDSGFLAPPQQAPYLKALVSMAFQSKEYDAAIDYGARTIKAGTADADVKMTVGQSYYQKGAFNDCARIFDDLVDEQIKHEQKPREQYLQLLQSCHAKLGNKSAETDALEKLVRYYPQPKYWDLLLFPMRSSQALDPRQKLWVYRLMWATGTLKQGADYNRFAEYAQGAGLPAEAQKVYEAGLKADVFKDDEKPRIERQTAALGKVVAADMEELPKLEEQAKAAATGDLDVVLGMSLHTYGDSARAIEVLQRGLAKGGLKEQQAIDGAMGLGMSQLRTRDNAAAQKTFESIKTSDADMARVVKLWLLYAR